MDAARLIFLLLAAVAAGEPTGGFQPVNARFPEAADFWPSSPIPAPAGSRASAYDIYDNHWALNREGNLLVLPAQDPKAWQPVLVGDWTWLRPDEYGYLWLANARRIQRFDPREPEKGAEDFTGYLKDGEITALDTAPSGAILVALESGRLLELDRTEQTTAEFTPAPARIARLRTDREGRIWAWSQGLVYRKPAPAAAWQNHWELVARLPGANHDLSGETIGEKFYMAGGQTATWGYPARPHVFDGVYEFDGRTRRWRVIATLRHPRFYNGTAVLNGELWVIAGGIRDTEQKIHPLATVEIVNPRTGAIRPGPELPEPVEMPLAVHIGRRIYLAGNGKLLSIAADETQWHREPDLPPSTGLKALAGAALGDRFFITVPGLGMAIFDTNRASWTLAGTGWQPRSAPVAAYRGEIWALGGRDVPDFTATRIFNPATGTWRPGPETPRELSWGAAATVSGRLMVTGGAVIRCYNNRTFLLRPTP